MNLELQTLQAENQKLRDQMTALHHVEKKNQELAEQVMHLAKVERSMIESQEKLDMQINFYRQLNEIAKRLKSTFVPKEILEIAMEFILYDLNFERCLILSREVHTDDASNRLKAFLWDGYEDDDENLPIDLTLSTSDCSCLELLESQNEGQDFVLSPMNDPIGLNLGTILGVDEFILCGIRATQTSPQYLIVLGNTKHRAKLFSRVTAQADYLVVLSNLLAQITGAIGQAFLYQATHHQAETLRNTISKLQSTQSQLIQTEKMSSLGQLVAGIAHEINNPVNFIYGNLTYAGHYTSDLFKLITVYQNAYPELKPSVQEILDEIDFDFLKVDFPNVISSMKMGASRIQEIVLSLRNFSRMDESEYKYVNIHDGIDNTLLILQHRLKATSDRPLITLTKQYTELPLVECAAGLLNQVFMNLLSNSIDAMESACAQKLIQQPEIQICTAIESNGVSISIIDNGIGIPEQVRHRLFDPFFTTKPIGKGTGLGLSISYQIIVEKHQGTLECHSTIGQGTEFRIWIPAQSQQLNLSNLNLSPRE
jgi:signal transduction histidine kinase